MAISSIHFAAGHSGYFDHNSREAETNNAIFKDEKNYCSANKKEAFELFKKELALRTEAYTERTGQKLQKSTTTHLSAIFNFNKDTTVEQAQKVCEYLEKKLDTKIVQLAMHRDEGHIIEVESQELHEKIEIKNYHGHIEMLGLDSNGNSIRRKLDKPTLRQIQTDVANILGMERGRETSYTKEEYKIITSHMLPENEYATKRDYNRAFGYFAKELGLYKSKKAKRLDTYEYKEMMKQKSEAVKELEKELNKELASSKDLQEINKQLREELKEAGASREDYAKLEQLNRELKEQLKKKDLTINELNLKIDEYKQNKAPKTNENDLNSKPIHHRELEQNIALKDDLDQVLNKSITNKNLTVKTGLFGTEKQNFDILDSKHNLRTSIVSIFTKSINDLYELAKEKAKKFYEDIIKEKDKTIEKQENEIHQLKNKIYSRDRKISDLKKEIEKPINEITKKEFQRR